MTPAAQSAIDPKAFGAYYTDDAVADFLVWWAIRSPNEKVVDPSFGGGVFLSAAARRIAELHGAPSEQIYGIELDPDVHSFVLNRLVNETEIPPKNLFLQDFFDFEGGGKEFDAVIGNPPFIRYQRFKADVRRKALTQAALGGVRLTQLSSSWAPFVVHATSLLKQGGRLAFVLPMELVHANYAVPVLAHLTRSFDKVTLLTFRSKLFPKLNEDTLLLLASNKGGSCNRLLHRDVSNPDELKTIRKTGRTELYRTRGVAIKEILSGQTRLIERFLLKETRELYQYLKNSNLTSKLGEVADIGIGYVTGANDYFHLTAEKATELSIPKDFLKPAIRRSRLLEGLRLTTQDWSQHQENNEAEYLFSVNGMLDIPDAVWNYIAIGEATGAAQAYKCRKRQPWYAVPHVSVPDAFLTYMSGVRSRMVVNEVGAVAPNTLHLVRLLPETFFTPIELTVLWTTSLTKLSVEIEGHSLGGGMLKLEPTEAENCLVAKPVVTKGSLQGFAEEIDSLIRKKEVDVAQDLADRFILGELLGLSSRERKLLSEAAHTLRRRRYER